LFPVRLLFWGDHRISSILPPPSSIHPYRQHVVRRIVAGKFAFKGRRWRQVSNEARQFVLDLLKVQPEERPTGVAALKLPWLQQDDFTGTPQTTAELMDSVQATVETFATYGRLKKLALLVIAYKSTNEEIGFLRRVFRKFDKSSDGEISLDDFKETLSEYHYTDEELERMFNAIDIDGTGLVHYSEFLAASIEVHGSIDEERIAEAFDLLDNDDSGYINAQNLRVFLGEQLPDEYLNKIIEEADLTKDHRISYQEFLALWDEEADVKKKNALVSVENRRRQGSSQGTMSRSSSISSSGGEGMIMDLSQMSANSSDLGGGDYFFGMEKDKSVRGVWL
jgi:Ca2+-binding EF-hand superfamily protein